LIIRPAICRPWWVSIKEFKTGEGEKSPSWKIPKLNCELGGTMYQVHMQRMLYKISSVWKGHNTCKTQFSFSTLSKVFGFNHTLANNGTRRWDVLPNRWQQPYSSQPTSAPPRSLDWNCGNLVREVKFTRSIWTFRMTRRPCSLFI
jgi:hypothetical protein